MEEGYAEYPRLETIGILRLDTRRETTIEPRYTTRLYKHASPVFSLQQISLNLFSRKWCFDQGQKGFVLRGCCNGVVQKRGTGHVTVGCSYA